MRGWKILTAVCLALSLAACQEESGADAGGGGLQTASGPETVRDEVVDIVTAQVSTACLSELPPPGVESDTPARVTLTLEDFSHEEVDGRHRFTHNRRFRETSGIGVTIYRGKVCVENGETCADACVRYRVEAGGSLTQRGHHFATPLAEDSITLQYWARDDAGHELTFQRRIETAGGTVESVE
jgi:hypothetical protein